MRKGVHPSVQVQANCIVVLDRLVEETLHQPMSAQRLFYFTLNQRTITRRPILVVISTGLKYFTSLGLKNI